MKSRNYINKNVVWFGSCGKDKNGNKIEAHNYESDVLGLISNLNMELSLLEGELWWDIYNGMPLLQKNRSKGIIDSYIIQELTSYGEIKEILKFNSKIENHSYKCELVVRSIYGNLKIDM